MDKKLVVMIDGGHLRVLTKLAGKHYDNRLIERFALSCKAKDEEILRILYYDCAPYNGTVTKPVSHEEMTFTADGNWLDQLAEKELFAVRAGQVKFRGFALDSVPEEKSSLADQHFKPQFQQKGVDMRIGLDIATYSAIGGIDRLVLVTNDTDMVPALKHARKAGLQVVLVQIQGNKISSELRQHSDFIRAAALP